MCENVFLLGSGVTSQGRGARSRVPTGMRLRSWLLCLHFCSPFKSLMDWPGICWVCDRAEHYMALTKGHEYGEALTHASLRRFYRHMTLQRQQSGYRLMLCPLRYSNWKNAPFPFHFGPQTKPGMCLKTLTHIWAHVLAITQYRCRRWPVSMFIYQKKFG